MDSFILSAMKDIKLSVITALNDLTKDGSLPKCDIPAFSIDTPSDRKNGDFSANIAMVGARSYKKSPRDIATLIVDKLETTSDLFSDVAIAGPGFINFYLGEKFYAGAIKNILSSGSQYGRTNLGNNEKVMVEFVSANPTGPMHMGNARGGALGDCLASVLDWSGHDVTREFYVNDTGNQIEKFGHSLEARYMQSVGGEASFEFPEDGYHGADIKVHADNFISEFGDTLSGLDSESRRRALIDYALPKNIAALKSDLLKYRIEFDRWFLESSIHEDKTLEKTIDTLKTKGLTYESDGALWYKATEFGGEKDDVLIRANGHPTYLAADIAYHYNKFVTRGFSRVINIWGADHHGHVARLKGAMDAIGCSGDDLEILLMQLVRLMRDGEVARMSKRTGKAITLSDLLEEISIDAARFFFNMRDPQTQMEFDLDLAVKNSSDNPVYYVQYAHARISSIIKNLGAEGISVSAEDDIDFSLLTQPEEKELIRLAANLPAEVYESAKLLEPARITKYITSLAAAFHKFYNACRVKDDNIELSKARLALCVATQIVIKNALTIISVEAPDVM